MKKSFFERLYLTVLIIFLLIFNGGVFLLAMHTYGNTVSAAEEVCLADHRYIAQAFEADYAGKSVTGSNLLMLSYGTFYSEKSIDIQFSRTSNKSVLYTNIPDPIPCPDAGTLVNTRIDGKRYIVVSDTVCRGIYVMTTAKDVSYLDRELVTLSVTFILISLSASFLLAVVLYLVMKKMFLPLEKLRDTTKQISGGNLDARANEKGGDEFAALAKDFNAMADKIGEQVDELTKNAEQKQQMLDNLAHEMRTPLTSIHGYAEYVYGVELAPEDRMKAMNNIMSEAMRLKSISEKLLNSAFIRENGIERTTFSVAKLFERTVSHFLTKASENGVRLSCVPCEFLLNGDEVLIELLISNLVENAIRACRGKGEIELSALREDGNLSLCVRDNGIGMTEEQLVHITEPFYRTDKSRARRDGGTGLGLALCKRIADAHGAVLVYRSAPAQGTTAIVRFAEDEA